MLADKVIQPDGFIKYDHIPYMTKSFYDSQEGQKIVKDAKEVGRKLNLPYEKVLSQWQIGLNKDDQANPEKQKAIWSIYSELKATLPPQLDLNNAEPYLKFIAFARRKAYDNGVSSDQFANLLETFVPEMGAKNEPDAFIYVDKRSRKELQLSNDRKHLKETYGIEQENAVNKMGGANRASGIAGRMIREIKEGQSQMGGGSTQAVAAGLAKTVSGFFSETGVFAGIGNYARWLSNADEISKPNSADSLR